jgi:alkaline phosphatase D
METQNEFVNHFGIPSSDPRHPNFSGAGGQRQGIYSANMFLKPGTAVNGIHLINLDARYHRSPTYADYGACEGDESTMLGATQWTWLENELMTRPSEIKIIASGIQLLPTTHHGRSLDSYCAYDGVNGSFNAANAALNEGPTSSGTSYESWAEMPQERTKLLHLVQASINSGNTKQVIFLSGDQHWAEIMFKEIPARPGQAAVHVYEVTASGIDQKWVEDVPNPNRLRSNSVLPVSANARMVSSGTHTCTGDSFHVCSARANYGGVEMDWTGGGTVQLSIYTPHETEPVAARLTINL